MAQFNISFPYSSSSLSYVTASIASTTVVAADNNRGKFILNLSGSSRAYVALTSAPATTTAYSFYMDPGDYYEEKDYKGAVTVIFNATSAGTLLTATSISK